MSRPPRSGSFEGLRKRQNNNPGTCILARHENRKIDPLVPRMRPLIKSGFLVTFSCGMHMKIMEALAFNLIGMNMGFTVVASQAKTNIHFGVRRSRE